MESLFPLFPGEEELKNLTPEELTAKLTEYEVAVQKINDDDAEYLEGYSADQIIEELEKNEPSSSD